MKKISQNEGETRDIARELAMSAKPGDIFALFGDLGSGKTTFTKGFIAALGVNREVTSPTFVIMKKYDVSQVANLSEVYHLDCYRFQDENDAKVIGLDEIIEQGDNIILIEWPERIWPMLENKAHKVEFKYIDENSREISW
jgi:tRNA threonylcarbamoyladenosine biosynthesis protein TsaE